MSKSHFRETSLPAAPGLAAKQRVSWLEILALVLVVAVGLALRVYRIADYPPGLHYDEAIDLWAGLRIANGTPMLYLETGWGREVLFYYVLAGVLSLVEDNVVALRVAAILCSTAVMLTGYVLFRRKAGTVAALFALAWYAVLFWSVFMSRVGNRVMVLPLMLNLTALAFWWGWDAPTERPRRRCSAYGAAGVFLGATFYTYQSSRFVPFIWLAFLGYLAIFDNQRLRKNWRYVALMIGVASLTAAPMAYVLLSRPGLEVARQWTIEPFTQLTQGNIRPVLQNLLATAGWFTVRGDPLVTYNVPYRPMFVPTFGGGIFFVGVVLAVRRFRRPFYAFMLLWVVVMLAPTVLTISPPNHSRTIGALPAVVLLAGLPLGEGHAWLKARGKVALAWLLLLLGAMTIAWTGYDTAIAYYATWPASKESDWTRNYNVQVSAVIDSIEAAWPQDQRPVVISSHSIEDAHPMLMAVTFEGDVDTRWVDATQAFVLPSGTTQERLYITADRWLDADLSRRLGLGQMATQSTDSFSCLDVVVAPSLVAEIWRPNQLQQVRLAPVGTSVPLAVTASGPVTLPVIFGHQLKLVGLQSLPERGHPGDSLLFFSAWEILHPSEGRPLSFFVHLLDARGEVVTQQDTLGYPMHSWRTGDLLLQVHRMSLPVDTLEGTYWLQIGVYERSGGQRWPVQTATVSGDARQPDAEDTMWDRVVLGKLQVVAEAR